ncbi:DUF1376 domain-containing protein [Pararhizobium sp. DWP1-1-3]|uniref:DUF1376 domain-containing protein n=1 Tax=Pararhizobium sp. DWP1-1-3 TaxID=2804652 RepID=UPI003CFA2950
MIGNAEQIDVRCLPYMPLQVEQLRKSKTWLRCRRRPELGFYLMNLWMRAWHEVPAGSIEDDDDVLADAAMCSPDKWEELRPMLLEGWETRDGRVYHRTVTEHATDAAGKLRKNSKRTEAARQAAEDKRTGAVTAAVTDTATSAVTEPVTGDVTDTVTGHEGKGREGKGREEESNDVVVAPPSTSGPLAFEANSIRLNETDLARWKKAFPHLGLEAELWALDEWAGTKGSKWFVAVSGALAKKEREAVDRASAAKANREAGGGAPARREGRI